MNKRFRALNDPIRRSILEYLREKDLTAGEIATRINHRPSSGNSAQKYFQAQCLAF